LYSWAPKISDAVYCFFSVLHSSSGDRFEKSSENEKPCGCDNWRCISNDSTLNAVPGGKNAADIVLTE
jgi:hypothetical protein